MYALPGLGSNTCIDFGVPYLSIVLAMPRPVKSAAPPTPKCNILFGYTPAISQYLIGQHTFFYVENQQGVWDVIDAGPEYGPLGKTVAVPSQRFGKTLTLPITRSWGKLITDDSPTGLYNENTNRSSVMYWEYSGNNACQLVREMAEDTNALNKKVNYGFPSFNSNSFTYTLDKELNLNIPSPPLDAVGWGTAIP